MSLDASDIYCWSLTDRTALVMADMSELGPLELLPLCRSILTAGPFFASGASGAATSTCQRQNRVNSPSIGRLSGRGEAALSRTAGEAGRGAGECGRIGRADGIGGGAMDAIRSAMRSFRPFVCD